MGYFVIHNTKDLELNAGQTGQWHWNNATPTNAVWSVNAVPIATGSTNTGFNQLTKLEVTRVWREFKVIENSTDQFSDVDIETEIHYEIKNLGSTKAVFRVYFHVAY